MRVFLLVLTWMRKSDEHPARLESVGSQIRQKAVGVSGLHDGRQAWKIIFYESMPTIDGRQNYL